MSQTFTTHVAEKTNSLVIIHPWLITKWLNFLVILLTLLNACSVVIPELLPGFDLLNKALVRYFSFDKEANFPTYFSTFIWLLASVILLFKYINLGTKEERKHHNCWFLLFLVCLFFSCDEFIQIHEKFDKLLIPLSSTGFAGLFVKLWIVPYTILALAIAAYFMKFVLSLPKLTRNLFFLAGFVFFFGAIAIEELGGYITFLYGKQSLYYKMVATVEELFEMLGVIIFIHAILDYIGISSPSLVFVSKVNVGVLEKTIIKKELESVS